MLTITHVEPNTGAQVESLTMSAKPANVMPSEVSILKSRAAAKRGLGKSIGDTETVWPKPEFVRGRDAGLCFIFPRGGKTDEGTDSYVQGPGTTIEWITKEGKTADGFVIPAG